MRRRRRASMGFDDAPADTLGRREARILRERTSPLCHAAKVGSQIDEE